MPYIANPTSFFLVCLIARFFYFSTNPLPWIFCPCLYYFWISIPTDIVVANTGQFSGQVGARIHLEGPEESGSGTAIYYISASANLGYQLATRILELWTLQNWRNKLENYLFRSWILNCNTADATVCPRSLNPFNIVSYYINWVMISWTYSIVANCGNLQPSTTPKVHFMG